MKANLCLRSKWAELNGAMGDLGTYIPIVLALTLEDDLNLGTTLIFTGVYNIITGAIYGVPMPVQPMKAIAAVAISGTGFGVPEIIESVDSELAHGRVSKFYWWVALGSQAGSL
ncbi:molybdate transporter 1 [Quercus suber]|uniref:Molybdate transporter 1 n=1 Tax=Quercus suber TaxID=58331 RepID=A0AAW0L2L5_QUESU